MNAEALIGMVLGTCTLQKIVGQGGMGAVFLAQQSRPRRQVAVKVLLPATSLTATQKAAFLERFRRETDAAASLEHPNIASVYEYGEQKGLAYLVMPYISGGTLRDLMEDEGQLTLHQALNYLEQLTAALDFAHERGVIHRDIKPANVLMTPDGRLLLTDFGLVKIVAEGQNHHTRLTGAGAPVGTPDYMSPEQVIGDTVDGRSDQYALGIILYQMLTATTPFQGETPMQIAAQQLKSPAPSPRKWRPELSVAVEQVIMRAMSKRPDDRYNLCRDFAAAFRDAINTSYSLMGSAATQPQPFTSRGLFDPVWQTGMTGTMPVAGVDRGRDGSRPTKALPVAEASPASHAPSARPNGLLSRTGMFPTIGTATGKLPSTTSTLSASAPPTTGGQAAIAPPLSPSTTKPLPPSTGAQPALRGTQPLQSQALIVPSSEQTPNLMTLTGAVKVVQMPIAGQPGKYVTGFLPTVPKTPTETKLPSPPEANKHNRKRMVTSVITLLLVLLLVSPVLYWYTHATGPFARKSTPGKTQTIGEPTPTETTATAAASNIVLSDPLSQNIHNWPENKTEFFAGGAYHILDAGDNGVAVLLAQKPFLFPFAYSLNMEEIRGNDSINSNSFGLILRFNFVTRNGQNLTSFYTFEVTNINGGEYQFARYDNSKTGSPWTQIWHQPFGNEYHQGQGQKNTNTFKVYENGNAFSLTVNGTFIVTVHDTSFKSGSIGMLVNLKGTEVAFSHMLITLK